MIDLWRRLAPWPGGKRLYSLILGFFVPYTGTLKVQILELEPGRCVARLKDRWRLRNHLNSIHAMALGNFAEIASGLSAVGGLPKDLRAILTKFEIEYLKKARGTLIARGSANLGDLARFRKESTPAEVRVSVENAKGECVAQARAQWLIGPNKKV